MNESMLLDMDWPRDLILAGGFRTRLTKTQVNIFHQFLDNCQIFQDFCTLKIDMRATELALQGGDLTRFEKLKSLYKQYQQLERQLFYVSKEWYEKNIKKESEVKTKET